MIGKVIISPHGWEGPTHLVNVIGKLFGVTILGEDGNFYSVTTEEAIGCNQNGQIVCFEVDYQNSNETTNIAYRVRLADKYDLKKSFINENKKTHNSYECIDIDGNGYKTVKIGNQIWMAENLKVTRYQNGESIQNSFNCDEWEKADKSAYSIYNNDTSNTGVYGHLYNWYAVSDKRDICPKGFHIPTDEQWMELESFIGMSLSKLHQTGPRGNYQGSRLAGNEDLWFTGILQDEPEFGTSGFIAIPGGYRNSNGTYNNQGFDCYFWSSSEHSSRNA